MKLTLRNGVHMKLQLQLLRRKCGTAQSPPSTRAALKATSTSHAADTTKGQSGVFLLVEVGGVDDIAVDLFISRDDGLQKHNCDGSHQ